MVGKKSVCMFGTSEPWQWIPLSFNKGLLGFERSLYYPVRNGGDPIIYMYI